MSLNWFDCRFSSCVWVLFSQLLVEPNLVDYLNEDAAKLMQTVLAAYELKVKGMYYCLYENGLFPMFAFSLHDVDFFFFKGAL